MLGLFLGLKGLVKLRDINTEGPVFRLHCRWTVLFLLCGSILLACREHFGEPIHCLQRDVARIDALQNFCWIHATFILPHAWNATVGVDGVAHPGITTHKEGQNKVYHSYYQWVALMLLLQAILFYFPKYLWKVFEKGTIKTLTLNLHEPLLPKKEAEKNCELLAETLHAHWGLFDRYMKGYLWCELLTLVNVATQMWLVDVFLGGSFTSFGVKVLQWTEWDQEYRTDPLVQAFPRMTKCQWYDYGSSGTVQRFDALCILPLNILNEKIYIALWFWMLFLCFLTVLVLVYRFILAAMPMLRYCVLVTKAPQVNKGILDKLVGKAHYSDWFMLCLLTDNMDSRHFHRVVGLLTASMEANGYVPVPSTSSDNSKLSYV